MTKEKVTVYSCVLNEAASIQGLMDSLLAQSSQPDEILVVDGGSKDGTLEKLRQYEGRIPSIRVVRAPGTNIAQARNTAFQEAKGDLIASTDGGCIARQDWLEQLLMMMGPDVDIVSGIYVADPQTDWEQVMQDFFYPDASRLPDDWNLPSHCSVLIRRKVWEAVGRIPENLYRSEDSWFNSTALRFGFRFRTARKAAVYRRPRQSIREVFRNTSLWVQSDIENGVNLPHELRRAARIAFRLTGKLAAVALWLAAWSFSAVAAILTLPLAAGVLVKADHRMTSIRYFLTYNAVDYVVMAASTFGLVKGYARLASKRSHVSTA